MEEEFDNNVLELLANYPDIKSVYRERDASLRVETSDTRLLLFWKNQTEQKRRHLLIPVYLLPVSRESKAEFLGKINVFPTPGKLQVEIEEKVGDLDVPKIIGVAKRGLELFLAAREIGFKNFPYSRVDDDLQGEDLMILRIGLKESSEESGIEFIDPKDYPDQMLRILKVAQISS
jgi:hypothetical protein